MPENLITPPFRKPVSLFKTPDQTIIFVTELVNRDDPAYTANAPVKRGTLYKDIVGGDERLSTTHPLLYFCRELQYQQSDQYVIWEWSSDEQAHSSYNADITYELEAAGFPVFTRVYTIRRDEYEQNPTIAIGSTLDALIGVTIVDGGQDYTYATGEIVDKDATVKFVVSDGVIISGVVTNEGTGVVAGDLIIVTGDGANASVIPMVQPTSAVLTSQKKEELPDDNPWSNEFVKVTRVYETLPGPTIHSTQLHVDGVVVDVATTKKVASTIVSGETLIGTTWTITTKTQDDNQYTGKEIVITRQVPGNPIPYSKLDDDGKKVTGVRTLKDTTLITTAETLVSTTWTHTYKEFLTTRLTIGEEASDLVSWEIVESRDIPGNAMPSSRLDEDGIKVNVVKTMESAATIAAITSRETLVTGTWTKITSEYISDLVSWKVVETRAIPGNAITKTTIDADGDIVTETRTMVTGPPTLVTTITTAGGVYTKTFGEPLTELVSWQVVQVKATQNALDSYSAEIPDLLPEEFRPEVPVTTHEETLIGVATAITLPLATGVLMESKAQIDYNVYKHTIRGRTSISLPQTITNKEITSEFGGGDVNRVLTLNLYNTLSLDEGLTVLSCNIRKIDDQTNGLAVKTTRQLNAASWPVLIGTHVDEKYGIAIGLQRQTVDAGTEGGGSGNTIIEVRSHDKWKSIQITSTLDVDSLPEDVQWFASMQYSFPPELSDSIIDWAEASCNCSDSFSAVLIANMNQYSGIVKTRITEQFYNGTPPDDVSITQFFPQSHNFGFAWSWFCGCTADGAGSTKSGAPEFHIPLCLHDDLRLCIGNTGCTIYSHLWEFPATSPAVLPHGDYIMLAPHVERWRFGVFRRVLTEVLVP